MRTISSAHLEGAPTVRRRWAGKSHWLEIGDTDPATVAELPLHLPADRVVLLIEALVATLTADEAADLAEALAGEAVEVLPTGANLTGANLSRAYLGGADLTDAYLGGANLARAYLTGANLSRANLGGANLSGANLTGANLGSANLDGADLSRANLSRANLGGAYLGLIPDGTRCRGDQRTVLPEGWRVDEATGFILRPNEVVAS